MEKSLRVLYIAGAGHSGSTLISSLIGMHERFVSGSEICFLLYDLAKRKNHSCSCGEKLVACPIWGHVLREWEKLSPVTIDQYLSYQKKYERLRFLLNPFKRKEFESEEFKKFTSATKILYEVIQRHTKKDWIIDASKSPSRAYILQKMGFAEIKIIHLVRDGRGLAYSMLKRGQSWFRALLFWMAVNLMTDIFLNKKIIPYEIFCAAPSACMKKIGDYIDEDLSALSTIMEKDQLVRFEHIPNGNGVRAKKEIKVKFDQAWKTNFSGVKRLIATIITAPFLWRYGYLKK